MWKKIFSVLGVMIIVPAISLLVSFYVSNKYENTWREAVIKENPEANPAHVIGIFEICQNHELRAGLEEVCGYAVEIQQFRDFSIYTLICSIFLELFVIIIGLIGRINRFFLAFIFKTSLYFILSSVCVLVAAQGALAAYGTYLFEATAIGRVHIFLVGGVALAAFLGVIQLLKSIYNVLRKTPIHVFGMALEKNSYPKLYLYVEDIAKKLGATPPKNIIVGIEPSFFVTCAKVITLNKEFHGETMYLSLPLLQLLRKDEVTAIIGHELGHFKGKDTIYSQKFYPIYKGTLAAISGLREIRTESSSTSLILMPAIMLLELFYSTFRESERKFGKEREFEADKCGAYVASTKSFSTGLIKASVIDQLWLPIQQQMVNALSEGKVIDNLSNYFKICLEDQTFTDLALEEIGEYKFSHPTDTHPTIHERIEKLGLNLNEMISQSKEMLSDSNMINEMIENNVEIEEQLSHQEHQKLLDLGLAILPDEK